MQPRNTYLGGLIALIDKPSIKGDLLNCETSKGWDRASFISLAHFFLLASSNLYCGKKKKQLNDGAWLSMLRSPAQIPWP